MAKICEECGKKPGKGHLISHSNIKTLRRYLPNLVKKRVFDSKVGRLVRKTLCTTCLRTMVKASH